MGGAVLTLPDAVMGQHIDRAHLLQRRHADRVAHIVAEHQKSATIGDDAAVQGGQALETHGAPRAASQPDFVLILVQAEEGGKRTGVVVFEARQVWPAKAAAAWKAAEVEQGAGGQNRRAGAVGGGQQCGAVLGGAVVLGTVAAYNLKKPASGTPTD